jgi:hypothetical protein
MSRPSTRSPVVGRFSSPCPDVLARLGPSGPQVGLGRKNFNSQRFGPESKAEPSQGFAGVHNHREPLETDPEFQSNRHKESPLFRKRFTSPVLQSRRPLVDGSAGLQAARSVRRDRLQAVRHGRPATRAGAQLDPNRRRVASGIPRAVPSRRMRARSAQLSRHWVRPGRFYRSLIRRRRPPRGRRVTLGNRRSSVSGVGSKRNRCDVLASTSLASIIANRLPMQTRGPPPNGK